MDADAVADLERQYRYTMELSTLLPETESLFSIRSPYDPAERLLASALRERKLNWSQIGKDSAAFPPVPPPGNGFGLTLSDHLYRAIGGDHRCEAPLPSPNH